MQAFWRDAKTLAQGGIHSRRASQIKGPPSAMRNGKQRAEPDLYYDSVGLRLQVGILSGVSRTLSGAPRSGAGASPCKGFGGTPKPWRKAGFTPAAQVKSKGSHPAVRDGKPEPGLYLYHHSVGIRVQVGVLSRVPARCPGPRTAGRHLTANRLFSQREPSEAGLFGRGDARKRVRDSLKAVPNTADFAATRGYGYKWGF